MKNNKNMEAQESLNLIGNINLGKLTEMRKASKAVKSQFFGSSMAAMSSDSIMRFPILMSASIGTEEAAQISKAFERQYAVFAMIVLSSSININSEKYHSVQDYLRELHNTKDAPNLLDYAIGLTSNVISTVNGLNESVTITDEELQKLWYSADASATFESLNNLYLPNKSNMDKIYYVLEASSSDDNNLVDTIVSAGKNLGTQATDKPPKLIQGEIRITNDGNKRTFTNSTKISPRDGTAPKFIESRNLSSNEPTLINAKIFINNTEREFILGVKTMTRLCDSDTMIRELSKAVENTNLAFKIIKWTRGEVKFFRDIVFGMTQAREDALDEKTGKGWFSAMRRRKKNAKIFIGGGRPLSPINTIVCTKYEVETVRSQTGIDLSDERYARKLMKDLYLMGFCILDETNGTVEIMLDGDATDGQFAFNTIEGLRRTNNANGGSVSLNDLRAFMKEIGNR